MIYPYTEGDNQYDPAPEDADYYIEHAPTTIVPIPQGAGRRVVFHPNGGTQSPGHSVRYSQADGTVGMQMVPPVGGAGGGLISPVWGGRHFAGWNLEQNGSGEVFTPTCVVPIDGITVYAMWGFSVVFTCAAHFNPTQHNTLNLPLTHRPDLATAHSPRILPGGWTFRQAIDAGLTALGFTAPLALPYDPIRPGFTFMGWYSHPVGDNLPVPGHVTRFTWEDTQVNAGMTWHARWEEAREDRHLVMFDMNHPTAVLQPGTQGQPQRLYRWVLNNRSIADSGLGGDADSGLGAPPASGATDGNPWQITDNMPIPIEAWRQNRNRLFNPTAPFGSPDYTPFTSGSGLINPVPPVGVTVGTAWPRSAPHVTNSNIWDPTATAPVPANQNVQRYTLEGWWEHEDGWRPNLSGTINSRRFAAVGEANNHTTAAQEGITNILAGLARRNYTDIVDGQQPAGIVTQSMTLYANWVYRVTFHPNGGNNGTQGFSIFGTAQFNPGASTSQNWRDIDPRLPESQRTVNDSGRRVRVTPGAAGTAAHQLVSAGMPPNPSRANHDFLGWFDRPASVAPVGSPNDWPTIQYDAQPFTGASVVNGSQIVYAAWRIREIPPTPTPSPSPPPGAPMEVVFNLNSDTATSTTEGNYGLAFWSTHRPVGYDNPNGRFFLSRAENLAFGIPGPEFTERCLKMFPDDPAFNLADANVHYNDRHELTITRTYASGAAIGAVVNANSFPRNPVREGYVFMGWHPDPDHPPTSAPWPPNTALNNEAEPGSLQNPSTLYAMWAPSFDLILVGNGGTGVDGGVEYVRNVAMGFTLGQMTSWWGGQLAPSIPPRHSEWHRALYSIPGAGTTTIPRIFTRPGFNRMIAGGSNDNVFSSLQAPTGSNPGVTIANATPFTESDFTFSTCPITGRRYVRIYQQWGATLTFNSNHITIPSGVNVPARTVIIAEGRSINDSLFHATRHAFQPNRFDVWNADWPGTPGQIQIGIEGTRGGWPTRPLPDMPIQGGDWPQLFTFPEMNDRVLIGWNTRSDGLGEWWYPHIPIDSSRTIYAIWGEHVIFDPGIGGPRVNMDPVRFPPGDLSSAGLRRQVIIGDPVPNFPGNPTWDNLTFVGWFPHIIRGTDPHFGGISGALVEGADTRTARTYFAVWEADVNFHPSYHGYDITGAYVSGVNPPGDPFPRAHVVGQHINDHGVNLQRPGGWTTNNSWWGNVYVIDPVTGLPVYDPITGQRVTERQIFTSAGPPIMQAIDLYPVWLANVTFIPNGGAFVNLSGFMVQNRNPESSLVEEFQRLIAPRNVINPNEAWWNHDSGGPFYMRSHFGSGLGSSFVGWRQLERNEQGELVPIPDTPLRSHDEIDAMLVTHYEYYFEAVWELAFAFYKGDMSVYDLPLNVLQQSQYQWPNSPNHHLHQCPHFSLLSYSNFNALDGAVFRLDRYDNGEWVPVFTSQPSGSCGVPGRVLINPSLNVMELPHTETIFRLVETVAPLGYQIPDGYWIFLVDQHGVVANPDNRWEWHQWDSPYWLPPLPLSDRLPIVSPGANNPPFHGVQLIGISGNVLPGVNTHYQWFVGNAPRTSHTFNFFKVGQQMIPRLPGARIYLYRFNGEGNPPMNLITEDDVGSGPNQWTRVGYGISSVTVPISFDMNPANVYQIVETIAPEGYRLPPGQWRVTVNPSDPPGNLFASLSITNIGELMPNIVPMPGPEWGTVTPETYLIHNWPITDLDFIKTDNATVPWQGSVLANAWFQLYWRADSTEEWEEIGSPVESGADGRVNFNLAVPIGEYRLVEIIPPPGFDAPFGHWYITIDPITYALTITSHGGNPQFHRHEGEWWVGNRLQLTLPLTGGSGRGMFILAGFALIFVGIGAAYWRWRSRKLYS